MLDGTSPYKIDGISPLQDRWLLSPTSSRALSLQVRRQLSSRSLKALFPCKFEATSALNVQGQHSPKYPMAHFPSMSQQLHLLAISAFTSVGKNLSWGPLVVYLDGASLMYKNSISLIITFIFVCFSVIVPNFSSIEFDSN